MSNKEDTLLAILVNMMGIASLAQKTSDLMAGLEPETGQESKLLGGLMAYLYIIAPATEMLQKIIIPQVEEVLSRDREIESVLDWMEQYHGRSNGDA